MVDTVEINLAADNPQPSLEETAKAMGIDVDNVDSTATEQTAKSTEQKILGKFESYEALEKAYKELESKLGQPKEEAQKEEVKEPESEQPDDGTAEEQAREAVENAGLNFDELAQEYWNNGEKLTDESYEKLEKAGIPKNLVDQFAQGQQAILQLQRQTVFNEAGSEDNYWRMTEWAAKTYGEAEIKAFNKQIDSLDPDERMLAVRGLKARYEAANGKEPGRTLSGGRGGDTTVYASTAQLMEDMANPKYQKDPAFRAKVEAKLARSNIF